MSFRRILFPILLGAPLFVEAGALETLRTMKQVSDAKGMYDTVQSIRTVHGMENAEPIYTKVKKIHVVASMQPVGGEIAKMNELVEEVVCDNIDRIVDNLEDYDLEGATPGCKTGRPKQTGKKRVVLLKVEQVSAATGVTIVATTVDLAGDKVLKTFKVEGAENSRDAVEKLIDDVHGDLVMSSRTNNPISMRKWPSRFRKYSKKKKHREIDMKRKQRKQLEANRAS